MKKIVCFLVGLTMLFTTAFASNADIISDALAKTSELTSCSAEMTLSTKINEPLLLLDTIPIDEYTPIDIKLLIEGLTNATSKINYSYSRSDDYKKMDLSISSVSDTPIILNEDLRIDAWSKSSLWMNYDVTDIENPVFKIIAKVPFDMKYQVIDFSSFIKNNPDLIGLFDKDSIEDIQKKMKDALLEKAQVTNIGNQYTLSLDDKSAKEYLIDILDICKEYSNQSSASRYESVEAMEEAIDNIVKVIEETTLLGENGLKITFSKNNDGIITAQLEELHIRFNMYDILEAYGSSTEGLTREQAFVDITMQSDIETSNHNKTEVVMPELTDENSEYANMSYVFGNINIISDEAPAFKNNTAYYPIESIASNDKLSLKTEIKEDVITLIYPGGQNVTASGNIVNQDGEEIEFETPPFIVENGKVYCTEQFLYLLNITWTDIYYDAESNGFKFKYHYEVNIDMPEPEDYKLYEPVEYISPTLYYTFDIDREAYMNNGKVYMPVYEFVQALFPGEFTFEENSLTYTASEENIFNIQTIKVSDGDFFVYINGVERPLEEAAIMVDGILNIPFTFIKELGMNSGYANVRYNINGQSQTVYNLTMANPKYDDSKNTPSIPKMLRVYISSDRVPYVENGEVYVPAYDFLEHMFGGEFTFHENGMEYVAKGENNYGIEKVSMFIGDNFVTVDDKKIELNNKVVSVDDVIRVPISFTEKLGMTVSHIGVYPLGTSYSFEMENPNYVEAEEPTEEPIKEPSIYDNWFYQL